MEQFSTTNDVRAEKTFFHMIVMQPHYQEFMNMMWGEPERAPRSGVAGQRQISFCHLYTYCTSCRKSLAALIVRILESLMMC